MNGFELIGSIVARSAMDDSAAQAVAGGMNYMPIFKVVIALYLLYMAVLGKGKLLDNKYLKISTEKYRLYMRLAALAGGLFVLTNGALEFFFLGNATYTTLITVFWILGLVCLVGLLVMNILFTDRKAVAAAQQAQEREMQRSKGDKLRAAFVFDDEEESTSPDKQDNSTDNKDNPTDERVDE